MSQTLSTGSNHGEYSGMYNRYIFNASAMTCAKSEMCARALSKNMTIVAYFGKFDKFLNLLSPDRYNLFLFSLFCRDFQWILFCNVFLIF